MKPRWIITWILALILILQSVASVAALSTLQVESKPGKLTVSGQANANTQVALTVTDQIYGGRKYLGQVKADNNGSFSVDVPLEIGSYRIFATGSSINHETTASVSVTDSSSLPSGDGGGGNNQQAMTLSIQVTGDSQRGVMLGRTVKTYPKGTLKTALDLLRDTLTAAGINYVVDGNGYVKAIGGLKEFDRGANSGWLYYVNNTSPPVGADNCTVNDGDYVEFRYVIDGLAGDQFNMGGGGIPDPIKQDTNKPAQPLTTSTEKTVSSPASTGDWANQALSELIRRGIIKSDAKDFQPKRAITRAEFVSLLYRAQAFKTPADSEPSFTDVKPGSWCHEAVEGAAQAGIIGGFSDGTFKPNQPLTRYQAAAILRNLGDIKATSNKKPSDHGQIPEWAQPGVVYVFNTGLMGGYPGGVFRGEGKITRAEAAALLVNYLNAKIPTATPQGSSQSSRASK
ncbi:MAG: S-layer homology domain-containing protein [Acidobacteriota bacterium]